MLFLFLIVRENWLNFQRSINLRLCFRFVFLTTGAIKTDGEQNVLEIFKEKRDIVSEEIDGERLYWLRRAFYENTKPYLRLFCLT